MATGTPVGMVSGALGGIPTGIPLGVANPTPAGMGIVTPGGMSADASRGMVTGIPVGTYPYGVGYGAFGLPNQVDIFGMGNRYGFYGASNNPYNMYQQFPQNQFMMRYPVSSPLWNQGQPMFYPYMNQFNPWTPWNGGSFMSRYG